MNPKELMISRYEAFKANNWSYLEETSLHQKAQDLATLAHIRWLRLEILNAHDNIVEFKAYYDEYGHKGVLHEKSYFVQVDGEWKYNDGVIDPS